MRLVSEENMDFLIIVELFYWTLQYDQINR